MPIGIKSLAIFLLFSFGISGPLFGADTLSSQRFIDAKQDGKWGLLDQTGNTVVPFDYDFISVDESGDIELRVGKRSGKADGSGRVFIPATYSWLGTFDQNGFAKASLSQKYGVINRANEVVLPFVFRWVGAFDHRSLFAVDLQGKSGVISVKKQWVIPPNFTYIGSLASNGLAIARVDSQNVGFIDSTGRWIIPFGKFDDVWDFADDGLAPAKKGGKWGFINSSGDWVVKPISENLIWPAPFNEAGLTAVQVNGKYGFINRDGSMVIAAQYDEVRFPVDGMSDVKKDGNGGGSMRPESSFFHFVSTA